MRLVLVLGLLLLPTSIAAADVVSPEPMDCPAGSEPVFCHGPPTCRALHCTGDAECDPGMRCVTASLCLERHSCGGRLIEPTYNHAFAACAPDGSCAEGACAPGGYCMPGTAPDASAGIDAATGRDAAPGTDAPAGLDAAPALDAPSGLDAAPATDSGGTLDAPVAPGSLVTSYGCGCRAHGRSTGALAALGPISIIMAARRRARWR